MLALPADVLRLLCAHVRPHDLVSLRCVCKRWKVIVAERWRAARHILFTGLVRDGNVHMLRWLHMRMRKNRRKRLCRLAIQCHHVEVLCYLHGAMRPSAWLYFAAAQAGSLACLRYAHERGTPWPADTCWAAARAGSLACLRYAHEHGALWDRQTCWTAARAGSLECLRYAREHGADWDAASIFYIATERNHTHIIKYIRG